MLARLFSTYLVGPVASLLPERWRPRPGTGLTNWERAAAISGLLELAAAIVAMCFWFLHAMARMTSNAAEAALNGQFGPDVTEHQIAGTALLIFATHPLTWMLLYAIGEGFVRFVGAAFFEDVRGIFPLYLLERALFIATHPNEAKSAAQESRKTLTATFDLLRERLMIARLPEVSDELRCMSDDGQDILEIWTSRRKEDWVAPKIVHVDEAYYRLEESSVERGTRPFRYRLRRLEAGVTGWGVLSYKTGRPAGKP